MGSIPIGTANKNQIRPWPDFIFTGVPGIEPMRHGIRTAAKRQTEVCRSPQVLTRGDFARWRSIPIGTAIRFRLRYSEIAHASEGGVLEKRMSRCNERSE